MLRLVFLVSLSIITVTLYSQKITETIFNNYNKNKKIRISIKCEKSVSYTKDYKKNMPTYKVILINTDLKSRDYLNKETWLILGEESIDRLISHLEMAFEMWNANKEFKFEEQVSINYATKYEIQIYYEARFRSIKLSGPLGSGLDTIYFDEDWTKWLYNNLKTIRSKINDNH